jgi:hypothetical protein
MDESEDICSVGEGTFKLEMRAKTSREMSV